MVDYTFTANMEKQLDDIVDRKARYLDVITGYDRQHQANITEVNLKLADVEKKTTTRLLGDHKNKPVRVGASEKGTYLLYNDQFFAIPGENPQTLTLEAAVALLTAATGRPTGGSGSSGAKSVSEVLHVTGKYEIRKGTYGYYFTDKTTNVSFPRTITTLAQIKKLKVAELDKLLQKYLDYKKSKAG